MLVRNRATNDDAHRGLRFFFLGRLERGVREASNHLRDGGHHAIVGILAMTLLRDVEINDDSRGEQKPGQDPDRGPARLRMNS